MSRRITETELLTDKEKVFQELGYDVLYTREEVCNAANVSRIYLKRLIDKGTLPGHVAVVGRYKLFTSEALENIKEHFKHRINK
jgi:hypothetical protein